MQLGNFFKSAPHCRPVNPRPVSIIAASNDVVLPGGHSNPEKRTMIAECKGALVFIGGEGLEDSRVDAKDYLARKYPNKQTDGGDFNIELTYQMVWRALHEYDPDKKRTADKLFPTVDDLRKMVEMKECDRVLAEYNAYVREEHPEGSPDDKTFPESKKTGN